MMGWASVKVFFISPAPAFSLRHGAFLGVRLRSSSSVACCSSSILLYYSNYILFRHVRAQLGWTIVLSEMYFVLLRHLYDWPLMELLLLRAGLLCFLCDIVVCWSRFSLASVRLWRRCAFWMSCTILAFARPWIIWRTIIVMKSTGRRVRCHGFLMIPVWVNGPSFRRLVCF